METGKTDMKVNPQYVIDYLLEENTRKTQEIAMLQAYIRDKEENNNISEK